MKQQFVGNEKELPPKHHDDRFVLEIIKNIPIMFRKVAKIKKWNKTEKASKDVPFNKSLLFVDRKDGPQRMCVDYQSLNEDLLSHGSRICSIRYKVQVFFPRSI
jgi:hypothetical protein